MTHHINPNFDHPANVAIVGYLRSIGSRRGSPASRFPEGLASGSPPGTHPDLVARLWGELAAVLPVDCRWLVYGAPTLVCPASGVVFAFAGGTATYGFRLPPGLKAQALRAGAPVEQRYSDGTLLRAADIGADWVFGRWLPGEREWCLAAYNFAEAGDGEP